MANIELPFDALQETLDAAQVNGGEPPAPLKRAMLRLGLHAEGVAKQLTGVVSGRMRAAWTSRVEGMTIIVENNVKYAASVNDGHKQTSGRYVKAIGKRLVQKYIPGQHMLEAALKETEEEHIERELNRAIKEMIDL